MGVCVCVCVCKGNSRWCVSGVVKGGHEQTVVEEGGVGQNRDEISRERAYCAGTTETCKYTRTHTYTDSLNHTHTHTHYYHTHTHTHTQNFVCVLCIWKEGRGACGEGDGCSGITCLALTYLVSKLLRGRSMLRPIMSSSTCALERSRG